MNVVMVRADKRRDARFASSRREEMSAPDMAGMDMQGPESPTTAHVKGEGEPCVVTTGGQQDPGAHWLDFAPTDVGPKGEWGVFLVGHMCWRVARGNASGKQEHQEPVLPISASTPKSAPQL